jgi:hypothetical protein
MRRVVGLMLAAAVLGACSTPGAPPSVRRARVYPAMGQFPDQQERDSHECAVWAQRENAKASGVGGALGTIRGAVTGAGTPGYGWNQEGSDRAYMVCMNSRGYSVIW